jgi:hypothetical protein
MLPGVWAGALTEERFQWGLSHRLQREAVWRDDETLRC